VPRQLRAPRCGAQGAAALEAEGYRECATVRRDAGGGVVVMVDDEGSRAGVVLRGPRS